MRSGDVTGHAARIMGVPCGKAMPSTADMPPRTGRYPKNPREKNGSHRDPGAHSATAPNPPAA
ncbi:hypothetical protein Rmf_14040 [Roseomonas fluvialis]|uniref:Uncharacterized protein n=1 Tax=Roseomonas fluvialis TaxID=1750527 RepID=A0ABM7Y114_9PROT|nr:hypothetical protein Rmf_14040 [Roseomonas fluvialis]